VRPGIDPHAYGWKVLVCCLLMARTNRGAVTAPVELGDPPELLDGDPDAGAALARDLREHPVERDDTEPFPLWRLILMWWPSELNVLGPPRRQVLDTLERQLRPLGFQRRRAALIVELADAWKSHAAAVLAGEMAVEDLPGCGRYAADAFDLFVRRDLSVEPADHVLAAWRLVVIESMDGDRGVRHDPGRRQAQRPDRGHNPRRSAMSATATPAAPTTGDGLTKQLADLTRPYRPQEVVKIPAGDVRFGDVVTHDGDEKRVERTEPSQSGATTRIVFEDGSTYSPRSTKTVSVAREIDPERPSKAALTNRLVTLYGERVALALVEHGNIANENDLDDVAKQRALDADKAKPGLGAKALATWITTGKGSREVCADPETKKMNKPEATNKSKTTAAKKSSPYPDDVRAAVKIAKEIAGTRMAPGPKQHVAVRDAVDRLVGETDGLAADVNGPLSATGFKSLSKLKAFARGEGGKLTEQDDRVRSHMKMLFEAAGSDPFARGKALASIVAAYCEQQAKAAK
jgi:hypothetical protein